MLTVPQAFETFRQRLELSKTEQDDARRRHKDVRACIGTRFDIKRDFLTGSYARHTKTKPLKDVDIFFVLGEKESHWRSKPPVKVLEAFADCLVEKYGADNVSMERRCVTVFFDKRNPTVDEAGRVLSVDAVPAYELNSSYEIPDKILEKWIKTDPEVHKEQATAKNRELDGKWIPLVKMLKSWNRSAGKPIKPSFLIEVMAHGLIDLPSRGYLSEVRRFFGAALTAVHHDWPDPAGYGPPVSDQMTPDLCKAAATALRQAEVKAARAVQLEAQGNNGGALALWREIMGDYFPTR